MAEELDEKSFSKEKPEDARGRSGGPMSGSKVRDAYSKKYQATKKTVSEDEWAAQQDSAALDTMHPGSMPVGPANKAYVAVEALKVINAMGPETINKFMASIDLIGKEARNVPDGDAAKNKSSIETKPSGASAAQESVDIDDTVRDIIAEDIEKLFEGEDLKEEFKERVSVLFESAINLKVAARVVELEEAYEAQLDEELETISENLIDGLDKFLDYSVEKWLEENVVAVESTLKSDLTEQFMEDLHALFANHYITVPTDRVDVVEELEARIAELEAVASENIEEAIALRSELEARDEEIEAIAAMNVVDEATKGLAATDAEKLRNMSESVEYIDLEDLTKKVSILRESIFKTVPAKTSSMLFEETEMLTEDAPKSHPKTAVDYYAAAIESTVR